MCVSLRHLAPGDLPASQIDFDGLAQRWQLPPELALDLCSLALYDIVLLCDDSGSMQFDDRIDDSRVIVTKIAELVRHTCWAQCARREGVGPCPQPIQPLPHPALATGPWVKAWEPIPSRLLPQAYKGGGALSKKSQPAPQGERPNNMGKGRFPPGGPRVTGGVAIHALAASDRPSQALFAQ